MADPQQKPIELPGDYFDRDPQEKPAAPVEVPQNFFKLPYEQQKNYLREENTLPEDLPQRTLKTAARAAPAIGATAAALVAPEITLPYLGAAASDILMGGVAAGVGGAAGSGVQSGIYTATGDEEAPASLLESVKRSGIEGGVQAVTEITGRGVGKTLEKLFLNPKKLYQMGLKPPPGRGQKVVGDIVKTGVDERIPLSEGGAAKLRKTIDTVNDEIEKVILGSPSNISPQAYAKNVEARFDALRAKYGAQPITGKRAVAAIDEAEKQFLVNHGDVRPFNKFMGYDPNTGKPIYKLIEPEDMSLQMLRTRARPMSSLRAQDIKKAAYEESRSAKLATGQAVNVPGWAPGTHPGLTLETTQEISRALREELGNVYGVKLHTLNARDGRLIELDKAINRYLAREGNRGLYRWGSAMMTGAITGGLEFASMGHQLEPAAIAGTTMGLIKGALDNPYILSKLAIAIDAARKIPGAGRIAREVIPGAARYGEYLTDEGYPRVHVVDPSDLATPKQGEQRKLPAGEKPSPWQRPDTAAPLAPADQAVLDRERDLKIDPTPGWRAEWSQMLADASQRVHVPLALLHVVADREGSGLAARQQGVAPNLVRSDAGAIGLMQVMPDTAAMFGYSEKDLEDPRKNIDAAARLLKYLLGKKEFAGKPGLVLAAYNAGEGTVRGAGYNVARMPKEETKTYVRKGLARWAQLGLPADQAGMYQAGLEQ